MKSGSVIVDLAAQTGGNCELTVADKVTITENGVKSLAIQICQAAYRRSLHSSMALTSLTY